MRTSEHTSRFISVCGAKSAGLSVPVYLHEKDAVLADSTGDGMGQAREEARKPASDQTHNHGTDSQAHGIIRVPGPEYLQTPRHPTTLDQL